MAKLPIVDTHVHFYDLRRKDLVYSWLQPDYIHPQLGDINAIKALVYTSDAYLAESRFANVDKVVHVQAALGALDPVAETVWLQDMAVRTSCPDAFVVHAPLADPNVEDILIRHLEASPRVRGIRDFGEGDYLSSVEWHRGYGLLEKYGLLCDLDCVWENMEKARDVALQFSNTPMVLEHAGYPRSRSDEYFRNWRHGLKELAKAENTWCKISGLGMYDHRWTVESWRPWALSCIEIFGVDRCFFGTNWPLDRLFSSFDPVIDAYELLTSDLSLEEQEALFSQNATALYQLN